jgi:hypothetical protein
LFGDQWQSCELCSTRFQKGAEVRHFKTGATILIGGTCLKTLQSRRFPPSFKVKQARAVTAATLRRHYGLLVHPGNWIRWIVEHAPKRFAQSAADLRSFAVVLDSGELDALIRFHDSKRLFLRNALLEDCRLLERMLHVKIPSHITINQARSLQTKADAQPPPPLSVRSADYAKRNVRPYIDSDSDFAQVWKALNPLEKRAATALVAVDDRAFKQRAPLCSDVFAANWPAAPNSAPMLVWNPLIGLGFVGPHHLSEGHKARIRLWRTGRYTRKVYDLQYWRGVAGCSADAVEAVEQSAFAPGSDTGYRVPQK